MKAQYLIDVAGQHSEVDAAGFSQILGGQRAGDRACCVPQFYGASASVRFSTRMLLDRRTIPCSEELDRLLAAHPLDLHHPVDVVAVSAADEAVVMVVVDDQARGVIIMEGAANFAVDQRFADQIRERNI